MKRMWLLGYQWLTAISDTGTGAMLYIAPETTLRLMGLRLAPDTAPYISYIGAFVLSVGLSCLYGALAFQHREATQRVETVWLLTAFSRAAVAIYLLQAVSSGKLAHGWLPVCAFDGTCALIQGVGLRRRWLVYAQ